MFHTRPSVPKRLTARAAQAGFTAVELLVTLFVAAAFLIAGYQLFNVVMQDGGETRAQAAAANVAYSYLRQYSDSATNPCAPTTPVVNEEVTVDTLKDVTVSVAIECTQNDTPSLSKVTVIINYNTPQKTLTYSTYVDRSTGATGSNDVLNGLVGWWKFNGNGSPSAGSGTATMSAASYTTNKDGVANTAVLLNGSTSQISVPNNSTYTSAPVSISFWVKPTIFSGNTSFVSIRSGTADGYVVGYLPGNSSLWIDCSGSGQRWLPGYIPPLNTWTHIVVVCNPTNLALYVNSGSSTYGGATYTRASNNTSTIATSANLFIGTDGTSGYTLNGSMDDVRLYGRALSASEAQQIYMSGPK